MKADLYTAQAHTAGTGGLAHRTAAGFVVLTSADGDDIIAMIEEKQNDADLIDQVVAMAQTDGPAAFAMAFTAGGEVYVIAAGDARIALASASTHISMRPVAGQVLVHALGAGLNETEANLRLHVYDHPTTVITETELQAGTVEAEWVEIGLGAVRLEPAPEQTPLATPVPKDSTVEPEAVPDIEPVAIAPPVEETPVEETPVEETPEPEPEPEPEAEPEPEPEVSGARPEPFPMPVRAPAQVGPTMVLGVACSQAHHNHPDAVYCSQCGTKMGVHHTVVLINGPRPPLGVLVVDDGTTYSLNEDLVIGREPTSHVDVIAGTASPMILTDDTLSLSRKHARIVLDDWLVAVQDLNSSNGTYMSRAGQAESWSKIASGTTMALEPGDRLRVGGRIIQVELHHVR